MKYSIVINQKLLHDLAPELLLNDAAVLDYVRGICTAVNSKLDRAKQGNSIYTWVNYKHLLESMPLLNIQTTAGICLIIGKLEKAGFITSFVDKPQRKKYIALTEKMDLLEWESLSTVSDSLSTVNDPPLSTVNVLINNNNNKDNKIADAAEKKEEKNYSPEQGKSKIGMSSVQKEERSSRKKVGAVDKRIYAVYKKIHPSVTTSIDPFIPKAIKKFEEYFKGEGLEKLIEALTRFSEDKWVRDMYSQGKWHYFLPNRLLTIEKIEEKLLPLVINSPKDEHLCETPKSESELREIEEDNTRKIREVMADDRRTKVSESGV